MSNVKRRVCHACVSFPRDAFCNVCDPDQSELAVLHGLCEDRFNELAALREELATQDRVLRSSVPEEHKGCTSPVGAAQNYIGDLERSLTAAEQRNAELVELLRMAWGSDDVSAADCKRIDAACAKPTESGASE